ncbi:MAG: extracellular solute-binding protein [Chloroflexi bacterium]|nr:extracellular solute-binding protein [Chloroflexota bacterium]MCC6896134.1 extracellular solute-binding protein [Anaerolineae bacterium]
MKSSNMSRRKFLQLASLASAGIAVNIVGLPAFAQDAAATPGPLPPAPAAGPIDLEAAGGMDALIEAARAEGELSTIALPDSWANYVQIKEDFFTKYDFLKHNDLNPDGSSAQEIEAVKTNAGNNGPQNPDVLDVGFSWGEIGIEEGLFQPYKVATWDSIPDDVKDPDGYWVGDYYGTLVFEVNADVVTNIPQDWSDLLKPEYAGQIALGGDPTGANQAIFTVWAAALANGGSLDDAEAGLDFFKELADSGNLLPLISSPATIARGETPITIRWDYNALGNRDANADSVNIEVVYPKSGSIAGLYIQAISAYAPRPNAARLWMEHLYSDEGQLAWLAGYAKPVRFDDLVANDAIPEELAAKLPASDIPVSFPSVDQINTVSEQIKTGWAEKVGLAIAAPA